MGRAEITMQGFGSTFRDWRAESVYDSSPREVCEHALAHSLPDKVEAAYRRGDLIEKRKVLMQTWADAAPSFRTMPALRTCDAPINFVRHPLLVFPTIEIHVAFRP